MNKISNKLLNLPESLSSKVSCHGWRSASMTGMKQWVSFRIYLRYHFSKSLGKFSSNRRLPSRLFSSTRRLFGSPSTSTASLSSNVPSTLNRSHTYSSSQSSLSNVPTQQRRLAEFATVLGDYKLAVSVWESLRKENKGGSVRFPYHLAMPRSWMR